MDIFESDLSLSRTHTIFGESFYLFCMYFSLLIAVYGAIRKTKMFGFGNFDRLNCAEKHPVCPAIDQIKHPSFSTRYFAVYIFGYIQ